LISVNVAESICVALLEDVGAVARTYENILPELPRVDGNSLGTVCLVAEDRPLAVVPGNLPVVNHPSPPVFLGEPW
jgi:hypothetical protein